MYVREDPRECQTCLSLSLCAVKSGVCVPVRVCPCIFLYAHVCVCECVCVCVCVCIFLMSGLSTRVFYGTTTEETIQWQIHLLWELLGETENVHRHMYMVATYENPGVPERRNEIWFIRKDA